MADVVNGPLLAQPEDRFRIENDIRHRIVNTVSVALARDSMEKIEALARLVSHHQEPARDFICEMVASHPYAHLSTIPLENIQRLLVDYDSVCNLKPSAEDYQVLRGYMQGGGSDIEYSLPQKLLELFHSVSSCDSRDTRLRIGEVVRKLELEKFSFKEIEKFIGDVTTRFSGLGLDLLLVSLAPGKNGKLGDFSAEGYNLAKDMAVLASRLRFSESDRLSMLLIGDDHEVRSIRFKFIEQFISSIEGAVGNTSGWESTLKLFEKFESYGFATWPVYDPSKRPEVVSRFTEFARILGEDGIKTIDSTLGLLKRSLPIEVASELIESVFAHFNDKQIENLNYKVGAALKVLETFALAFHSSVPVGDLYPSPKDVFKEYLVLISTLVDVYLRTEDAKFSKCVSSVAAVFERRTRPGIAFEDSHEDIRELANGRLGRHLKKVLETWRPFGRVVVRFRDILYIDALKNGLLSGPSLAFFGLTGLGVTWAAQGYSLLGVIGRCAVAEAVAIGLVVAVLNSYVKRKPWFKCLGDVVYSFRRHDY